MTPKGSPEISINEAELSAILRSLPDALIAYRKRLCTQGELAELLGVHEQQIQRYESSRYQSASLKRLSQIAKLLEALEINQHFNPGATKLCQSKPI